MYLKRSSSILVQMLRQKFNYALESKNERQFICRRLGLFDQVYCLEVDLKLQQSYLETGLHEHRWPVRFVFLPKIDDHTGYSHSENLGPTLCCGKNDGFRSLPTIS